MKSVVITGVGIKSCIGNDYNDVLVNLKEGKSGIKFNETYSKWVLEAASPDRLILIFLIILIENY